LSKTYQETLEYLFRQLPMFQRTGASAYKKDLSNTYRLLEVLGNPQKHFRSIHIAGTNGKGSVAHMLSAALQQEGCRTGLYTSPHYRDFRERIRIDGQYVPEDFVIDFTERMAPAIVDIRPSFFEITVAMAFDYFTRQEIDLAVVETGLGGRLDSTNVLRPLLSVITNISFDHQQFLGDTLPLIAGEKAGIIKQQTPVVIGETHPETHPVFVDKARSLNAPIYFADQHYRAERKQAGLTHAHYDVFRDGNLAYPDLVLNAVGAYQVQNLQTALAALAHLSSELQPTEAQLRAAFRDLRSITGFMGRWQMLGERPTVVCESAHNESGMRLAVEQLLSLPHRQLRIVLGMVKDKEIGKMLSLLPPAAVYYFACPNVPRGLEAAALQAAAAGYRLKGNTYDSVGEALAAARQDAAEADLIYVGGSTFVVAEVV